MIKKKGWNDGAGGCESKVFVMLAEKKTHDTVIPCSFKSKGIELVSTSITMALIVTI